MMELLEIEARILHAWVAFRNSHNLENAELACCERTKELFASLQAFENVIRAAAQEEKQRGKPN